MSPLGNSNQGPAPLLSQFHGSSSAVTSNGGYFKPGSPIPTSSASAVSNNNPGAALSLLGPALPQSLPSSSDSVLPFPLSGNASGGNSSGSSEARIPLPSTTASALPTYSGILGGAGGNNSTSPSAVSSNSPPNLSSTSQHSGGGGGHQSHGPVSHQQQHHSNSHGHGPSSHQSNHGHAGNFHHNAGQHNQQGGGHSNLGQNSSNNSVGMIPALSLQQHSSLSSAQAQNLQQQHHVAAAAAQFYAAQPQIFVNASGQAMYYRPSKTCLCLFLSWVVLIFSYAFFGRLFFSRCRWTRRIFLSCQYY
jgi:hypothetical protein